jgi:hypothetical protein
MRRFTDPEIVFHYEGTGGGMEQTLEANEDGTLTHDESPNHYAYLGGAKGKVERRRRPRARFHPPAPFPDRAGKVSLEAGRAVPNAKLSDREGSS